MAGSLHDNGLNASLLKQLECPVCFETCVPPITMCVRSHIVCSKCAPNLTECALCRQPMASERCWFAEDLSTKVKLPCSNTGEGCKNAFSFKEMESHLPNCKFKSYPCMILIYEGLDNQLINGEWKHCQWTGQLSALVDHVSSAHEGKYFKENIDGFIDNVYSCFGVQYDYIDDCVLLSTKNKLFWFIDIYWHEKKEREFICLYTGPQSLASKFAYKFELGKKKTNTLTLCNESMLVNMKDREGKTFKIGKDLLKLFLTPDGILYLKMFVSEK